MATRIYEWNYSWGKDINDEIFRNYFRYKSSTLKITKGKDIEILIPKKILHRLSIALAETHLRTC